jgi:hypothetical protein
MSISSYQSMINNNMTGLSTTSTGSSVSNSSSGSTGGGSDAPMSLAAANVVRGIMEKVLSTPPMGSGLMSGGMPSSSSSNAAAARLFNELDYLSSPGLDSDFGDVSPLLCSGSSSSNLSNQYLRLAINSNNNNNKEQQHCHHGNFLSR